MFVSQYITDSIQTIEHLEWRKNYEAFRILKNAAQETEDLDERHILDTVGGALSMSYNEEKGEFAPFLQLSDGNRSFAIEDITNEDIKVIEKIIDKTKNLWIRAQLAHILYLLTPVDANYRFAEISIQEYIMLFWQEYNPEEWTDCYAAIKIAASISSKLGKKSNLRQKVYSAAKEAIVKMNGTDPLYLSISLIKLICKDASEEDLQTLRQIMELIISKNLSIENTNFNLAEESVDSYVEILNRQKDKTAITTVKNQLAEYLVAYAEKEDMDNAINIFLAMGLLKKACNLYKDIDQSKLFETRNKLEVMQKKSLESMKPISLPFDMDSAQHRIDKLFKELDLKESIVQFGRISMIYKREDTKQQVIRNQKEYVFNSMFGSSQVNEFGQAVQYLPPLSRDDPELDFKLLFKHMIQHVVQSRSLAETIYLKLAFDAVFGTTTVSVEDVAFLIEDNPIVPENREGIIKKGIHLGLAGDLYASMHILLPQVENIFRQLVKMCGDTVTFLDPEYGIEGIKPLSQLFKSEKLCECYNEDVIFTFQSIMDIPGGENLRNLVAHGLFEPHMNNDLKAICFLSLIIKLLSWYSQQAQPILRKLVETDDKAVAK